MTNGGVASIQHPHPQTHMRSTCGTLNDRLASSSKGVVPRGKQTRLMAHRWHCLPTYLTFTGRHVQGDRGLLHAPTAKTNTALWAIRISLRCGLWSPAGGCHEATTGKYCSELWLLLIDLPSPSLSYAKPEQTVASPLLICRFQIAQYMPSRFTGPGPPAVLRAAPAWAFLTAQGQRIGE